MYLCYTVCNFCPFLPRPETSPTGNGWVCSCHCLFGLFLGSVFSWVCSKVRWDGQRKHNGHSFSLSPSCSTRKAIPQLDRHHTFYYTYQYRASSFPEQRMQNTQYEGNKHTALWGVFEPPFSNKRVFFIFLQWRNSIWLQCNRRSNFTVLFLPNPSLHCNAQAEQRAAFFKETQTVCWLTWALCPTLLLSALHETWSSSWISFL